MLPKTHFIFGLIFALIIFYLFPQINLTGFFIILMSSFLIDIDHYLLYIIIKRDFNLKKSHKWFVDKRNYALTLPKEKRRKLNPFPCIFHGFETTAILILLSFVSVIFFYILLGFLFHELLDGIYAVYYSFPLSHLGSQIINVLRY